MRTDTVPFFLGKIVSNKTGTETIAANTCVAMGFKEMSFQILKCQILTNCDILAGGYFRSLQSGGSNV